MPKNELREDLEVCENYINDVPNIFNPCKLCEKHDEEIGFEDTCHECCWFYGSYFELKK